MMYDGNSRGKIRQNLTRSIKLSLSKSCIPLSILILLLPLQLKSSQYLLIRPYLLRSLCVFTDAAIRLPIAFAKRKSFISSTHIARRNSSVGFDRNTHDVTFLELFKRANFVPTPNEHNQGYFSKYRLKIDLMYRVSELV
jgi:hypothetical protein